MADLKNYHDLSRQTCKPCEGGVDPLTEVQIAELIAKVPGWEHEGKTIARQFVFKDHYQAMAFANAVAWISHTQNHHPDMEVGYNKVTVRYWTHSVDGLTEGDFICAAKVTALLDA
jgi:4a-hydroxytetrahydrobiopterin dehydratase